MILRWLMLVLSVVVFSPSLLHAQQLPSSQAPGSNSTAPSPLSAFPGTDSTNYDKMYEDIEILRRILDRKLEPLYPSHPSKTSGMVGMQGGMVGMQGGMAGMQGGMRGMSGMSLGLQSMIYPAVIPIRSLEGVYLKRQGVIYTATLSSLQPPAKVETDGSARDWAASVPITLMPADEWESVQRKVRKEKEEPKKPEASKPPSLSDVLLKVLAENGHHFSQLGENESLTIVITVHKTNPPSSARKSAGGGSGGSAKTVSKQTNTSRSDRREEASDFELLGDLHQKQGHYGEAIKAFGRAAAREPGPGPNEAARLYRKMAQCFLALGQDEEAQEMVGHIHSLRKESEDAKDKPAPAAKPVPALPVKLIISAPKKLLDEAKGGKISFEEFRRRARVETLEFGNRR